MDYFSDSDLARIGTAPDHLHTRFTQDASQAQHDASDE